MASSSNMENLTLMFPCQKTTPSSTQEEPLSVPVTSPLTPPSSKTLVSSLVPLSAMTPTTTDPTATQTLGWALLTFLFSSSKGKAKEGTSEVQVTEEKDDDVSLSLMVVDCVIMQEGEPGSTWELI
ncbi:hypothetical protein HAX54_026194 [Datura stramonium]|uniref:Uncharacterized protein n=1 Tax=Datura stramonium TaxID=4076 RepID=A0ABS8V391_DATST|nr:hypothetical protein [Datura stramonium]